MQLLQLGLSGVYVTRRYQQKGLSLKRESVEPPQPRFYYRGPYCGILHMNT